MKRVDLTNQRFGRLVVLRYADCARNGNARWECQCDCGKRVVVDGYRLRHGSTISCGCYRKDVMRKQIRENKATRVHIGDANSLLIRDHVNLGAMTTKSSKNHSGVIGVSFDKASQTWDARLTFKGKLVLNKRFKSIEEAIRARKEAERIYLQPLLDTYAPDRCER